MAVKAIAPAKSPVSARRRVSGVCFMVMGAMVATEQTPLRSGSCAEIPRARRAGSGFVLVVDRGRAQRQDDVEGAPEARGALHRDLPAMGVQDVLHDAQAQSGAAAVARAVFVHPVEALEDVLLVLVGHARTIVGDLDVDVLAVILHVKADLQVLALPVFEGVVEEVEEDLLEPQWIGGDRGGAGWRW